MSNKKEYVIRIDKDLIRMIFALILTGVLFILLMIGLSATIDHFSEDSEKDICDIYYAVTGQFSVLSSNQAHFFDNRQRKENEIVVTCFDPRGTTKDALVYFRWEQ